MATIGKSKFTNIINKGTFPLPSPLIMADGEDNVTAVIATQINWGENTYVLGQYLTHGYTSELLDAIESKVSSTSGNVLDEAKSYAYSVATTAYNDAVTYTTTELIKFMAIAGSYANSAANNAFNDACDYMQNNLPVLNITTGTDTAPTGYYCYGLSVSGHTVTPLYKVLPTHPLAADLWEEYEYVVPDGTMPKPPLFDDLS